MSAARGAPTASNIIEVDTCAQTNSGRRASVMPGARKATTVVRKLVEAMIPLIAQIIRLTVQRSTPRPGLKAFWVSGG